MSFKTAILTALIALAAGFAGSGLWSMAGLDNGQTRAFLMENPDILPEMAEAWQKQEAAARLSEAADGVDEPFPGAVIGNPEGSKVLVEFSDYGCTYCRSSLADVEALVAADPEVKVVVREWAIFDGSEEAARMALAAARQGKYAQFHKAMFDMGPPSEASIERAARSAGLDYERALADAASPEIAAEIVFNRELARSIGFTGTPSWVANGQVLEGAVGRERLADALEEG